MVFTGFERKLIIKPNALNKLKSFEKNIHIHEHGGILLGKVYSKHIFIEDITTPNIFDKFGKFFFIRSLKPAQKIINKLWKISSGQTIYLGEWHTHNEEDPKPSDEDFLMIENCYKNTIMEIDFLFLIIAGLKDSIWAGVQTSNGLKKLKSLNIFDYS